MDKCIIFKGAKSKKGYGVLRINNMIIYAHRLAYRLYNGDIPKDRFICHKCDNPSCINPAHLFAGTAKENTDDMSKKGRGLYGRTPINVTNSKTGETKPYNTQGEFAREIGVNQATISYALRRKTLVNGMYEITHNNNTQKQST